MSDLTIYNCHVHTFTTKHVPRHFLKLIFGRILGPLLNSILRLKPVSYLMARIVPRIERFIGDNLLMRQLRFVVRGNTDSQAKVFEGIQKQYPKGTVFVVLPMDMAFMNLGSVDESIDVQHGKLLALANESNGCIVPFYAVDPRRENIEQIVRENLVPNKFRGVKIYPNLGYSPQCENLMRVYEVCQERSLPVMTHCTPNGVWQYKLSDVERRRFGHPGNYEAILTRFPDLRLCLAHFGGGEEWAKHLRSQTDHEGDQRAWVRWIADMIRSGEYPNLYTDISYTIFTPKLTRQYFDYFDYLKVLLADQRICERVLFGSDYYMVERELVTEKEVSIVLRSRLGENLYFQIAHHNPKRFLGIS